MKLPKGTRDLFGSEERARLGVIDGIRRVFEKYGAEPMSTPVFELKETLAAKYGQDNDKLVYDLADQGGDMLSLRYDLTVPLARHIATHGARHFTRYQIGNVYRRDQPKPSAGRYREFVQADFDILGPDDTLADALLIRVAHDVFRKLIPDFKIVINHRVLLYDCLTSAGVPRDQLKTICSSVDKLDKSVWTDVREEMLRKGLDESTCDAVKRYMLIKGDIRHVTQNLQNLCENESQGLRRLIEIQNILEDLGVSDRVVYDVSLARGVDYYTGIIFEVKSTAETSLGSIGAGGRYDNLIDDFCGMHLPAAGFSVGVDRVMSLITLEEEKPRGAYILPLIDEALPLAYRVARMCWDNEMRAVLGGVVKPVRGLQQAQKLGVSFTILIGKDEMINDSVTIKNMTSRDQYRVGVNELDCWFGQSMTCM